MEDARDLKSPEETPHESSSLSSPTIFTWREKALKIAEYHELKVRRFGAPIRSNQKTGWSIQDTANELNYSVPTILEYLKIAKALRENPELIESARTRTEALRILNRQHSAVEVDGLHGVLVKTIQLDGYDYYIVKLNQPIRDKIKMICVPMYLVKHYRRD